MWILKEAVRLTRAQTEFLESLPDNLPETKLSQKQKDEVDLTYIKTIGRVESRKLNACWELEQASKWPGSERMKRHEAKRIMLDWLVEAQRDRAEMNDKKAAKHFYGSLSNRASWVQMLSLIYEEAP